MTVTQMITSLSAWLREEADTTVATEAISDSILALWETLVVISLSELLGGPITATFGPASEVNSDVNIPADIWYIQSLSLTQADGTQRFWESTEIGSELWRRFERSTAGATPFAPYVYDFNGTQIRTAPTAAMALSPKYFYVKRPTALTDSNMDTDMPFHHPGAETFIRYNAMSLLLLSVNEFQASGAWGSKAEAERQRIIITAARKNERKNLRVQPLFR